MVIIDPNIWRLWAFVIPLAPILGWLLIQSWSQRSQKLRKSLLVLSMTFIFVGICSVFTPWSFRDYWLQAVNLALSYAASVFLVFWAFNVPYRLNRNRELSSLFVLSTVVYGLFIAWWRADFPVTQSTLSPHLLLRRTGGGFAGNNWEGVTIVQQPAYLPFLEKNIYSINIGWAGDCDESSVHVSPDIVRRVVVVSCGTQNPYIFAQVKMP